MNISGPRLSFSERLHAEKYRSDGESFRDSMSRIAAGLKDSKTHYHEFREILLDMRFLPAGRIQAAIGTPKTVTAMNCFVGGVIPDSFVTQDNEYNSSIMHRAGEAATTMRMGGGLGNDFSTLRPTGANITKLGSASTGPLSFMEIFNAVGDATSSTGQRRGAQMGVLRIDHPDIIAFINAKHDNTTLKRFNLSVAVTDKFMEHLESETPFPLVFENKIYRYVDPVELWETLMRSTWDYAEPGVVFVDRVNYWNNLWYCEKIFACNPCAEQMLPPNGACLLGSYNLVKYIRLNADGKRYFDYTQLAHDIPIVTRAMDNIINRTIYPLPAQRQEQVNKRRMGIGGTGLANAGEALGFPYGSSAFLAFESGLCELMTNWTYQASSELAEEKGSFPLFDADLFSKGKFIQTLDPDLQKRIHLKGLRNSHLISWAPTGTISMTADNVSSSLEPVYQYRTERPVELPGGKTIVKLYDYGFRKFNVRGRRAANSEISVSQHVDVLVTAQKHTDSAVSKTINTDGTIPWDDFKNIYVDAFNLGAKGLTTFNKDGKRFGLFKAEIEPYDLPFPDEFAGEISQNDIEEAQSCSFDPSTGRKTCE